MVPQFPPRYIVNRQSGAGTVTGEGDILIDNLGGRWRQISEGEASIIRQGTAVTTIAKVYPNGTIG